MEVRLDEGPWVKASGTLVWSFDLDTASLVPGLHKLRVRATDANGEISQMAEVQFTVDETKVQDDEPASWFGSFVFWMMILLFVMPLIVAIVFYIRWKH